MSIIKCKMCGGDVRLDEDKTFGTCEYCGCTMTFPKVSDEQRAAAFNRGNHFRRMGEFDKALAVYERILAEDDADAEAHWCCALCRFGIEYVEDPNTYEWLPTCHRASFDSFLEDLDYLAALEHSEGITRRQYQKDAAKIAEVQRGILATSQNTKPYDVFISYKELDENGERTRDSILAQEIYYRLTEKGWRVFFSRISLEDVPGTEYEPYIFAALNSAKVMVVVGTSEANLNAVWVKNEWSRFLAMMRKDRSKLLIPCYRDMDPYDLPEQLSVLMSYDMSRIGFIQDLIRGVDKVLSAEKPKEPAPAPVQERVIVQQASGGPNVTALLKRGQQALEDGDWEKADEFFDQALNMDAESAEAFLGKFLAQEEVVTLDELFKQHLAECDRRVKSERKTIPDKTEIVRQLIDKYALPGYLNAADIQKNLSFDLSYQSFLACRQAAQEDEREWLNEDRLLGRARRYAAGETGEKIDAAIRNFEQQLSARVERSQKQEGQNREKKQAEYDAFLAQAEKRFAEQHQSALEAREAEYQACCSRQEKAETVEDYQNAIAAFQEKLGDYKDTEGRISQCRTEFERLNEQERQRKEAEAKAAAEEAERQQILKEKARAAEARKRKRTIAILTPIVLACIAFVIVLTTVIIPKQKLNKAMGLLDAGDYEAAYALLEEIGDNDAIASSKYDRAIALIDAGDYEAAYALLNGLNYKDSVSKLDSIKLPYKKALLSKAQVGSWITFGSYEQDNNTVNGKEDIEWQVLEKDGNRILVISRYALDCQQYNTSYTSVTWETSSLRKWLNGTFLNAAFSAEEQAMIPSVSVSADKNPSYSTSPGNSTTDQVFLLSITEANKYFSSDEARKCALTDYAIAQGAWTYNSNKVDGRAACWWWLRSPGGSSSSAAYVRSGSVYAGGFDVIYDTVAVRPALWITLD